MNAIIYGPKITPGALALSILQAEGDQREHPPGSNRGERIDIYLHACGLDPERGRYPWCAAAVTWAVREAGLRLHGMLKFRGSASVSSMLARNAALAVAVDSCGEGDVLIHIGPLGNHTGFFVRNGIGPGRISSLEGNTDEAGGRTGGRLMSKTRPASYWTHALRVC
jgi:hypothetical protein